MPFKCDKCGKKFDSEKEAEKHEKNCKEDISSSINEEQYANLKYGSKGNYIKEWVCKCNECGKKWAYLDSVEKEMRRQATGNALMGLGMCCNPCMVLATSNANTQLSKQIKELKQCPECKSSNVKCETRYFKKS